MNTQMPSENTSSYIKLDNDEVRIKTYLSNDSPVIFSAALFESFMSDEVSKTGIVPIPDIQNEELVTRYMRHPLIIVGYDDDKRMFLVHNSWYNWGQKGCCLFPYDYLLDKNLCTDFWVYIR
jgi:C1A family cysteine protease